MRDDSCVPTGESAVQFFTARLMRIHGTRYRMDLEERTSARLGMWRTGWLSKLVEITSNKVVVL